MLVYLQRGASYSSLSRLVNEPDYQRAISMYITQIDIENVPPLGREIVVGCDERVNLLVGPNASGKTTILRAMHGMYSSLLETTDEYIIAGYETLHYDGDIDTRPLCFLKASDDWPRKDTRDSSIIAQALPVLYIPATRVNLRGRDIFSHSINEAENAGPGNPLNNLFDTDSGIFNGQYVESGIDWLTKEKVLNRNQQDQLRNAIKVGYSCTRRVCPEVLYDEFPHPFVEFDEYKTVSALGRESHYGMGIGTTDDILGEPLYAGALSSGTQGTLLWIWALALKMAYHYDWEEGWQEKPAILLIDEIENHLHPTWQRRVIPALLEHFPKLQIFATTHSPFVVAGLKAGQVHLLKRDDNGHVTATTNDKDIIGWTMDEILRTMMGVDDPTDDVTAAAARELRQLRNEWPRSSPEEEQKRQQRIAELRQKVDRDLLAGGPWKRRREEFAERFQAALEKYGLPPDLGQENG